MTIRSSKPSNRDERSVSRSSPASPSTVAWSSPPAGASGRSPGARGRRRTPHRARPQRRPRATPSRRPLRRDRRPPGLRAGGSSPGVEESQVEATAEDGGDRTLLGEPPKACGRRVKTSSCNESEVTRGRRSQVRQRLLDPSSSISRTQAATKGSASPESSSMTSLATPGATLVTRPSTAPPSSTASSPTRSAT